MSRSPRAKSLKAGCLVALGVVLVLAVVLAAFGLWLFHTPRIPLPDGVRAETRRVKLTGRTVSVDLYLPPATGRAPVAVIAHGFPRRRRNMAGWGGLLAANGFIAAVPDLPTKADHGRNSRAIVELLDLVRSGKLVASPPPAAGAVLVGFSAGGFSTVLAAEAATNVLCWAGLDPVDGGGMAAAAARRLHLPAIVLRAEPAPWNADGNGREIARAWGGPLFELCVARASHADAEYPTDRAAQWACGPADPARRRLFERYLIAGLRAVVFGDEVSRRELLSAAENDCVREVVLRHGEAFGPHDENERPLGRP